MLEVRTSACRLQKNDMVSCAKILSCTLGIQERNLRDPHKGTSNLVLLIFKWNFMRQNGCIDWNLLSTYA